ncbi:MAG: hypothetical protein AAB525_02135 [Patescibacteria group bacterium]
MPTALKTINKLSNVEILEKGWQSLLKNLGPVNATFFIQSFPRGKEDSVKYWKNFWGNKNVDDIHEEILIAKKSGEI